VVGGGHIADTPKGRRTRADAALLHGFGAAIGTSQRWTTSLGVERGIERGAAIPVTESIETIVVDTLGLRARQAA